VIGKNIKKIIMQLAVKSPLYWWPVRVRSGLAKGAQWTLLPYGSYWRGQTELDVENAIKLHGLVEGASCWDLGAHYGIYAVGMALSVGPRGRVAAFEPDPLSFAKCKYHVEVNRLTWCEVFNAACSDSDAGGVLITVDRAGDSTSHLHYEDEEIPSSGTFGVQTVVLDSLVKTGAIAPPDFVKVDVEGHGAKALAGAIETLRVHKPTILMSFHSPWEWRDTQLLLEGAGYRPYDVGGESMAWKDVEFRTAVLMCR